MELQSELGKAGLATEGADLPLPAPIRAAPGQRCARAIRKAALNVCLGVVCPRARSGSCQADHHPQPGKLLQVDDMSVECVIASEVFDDAEFHKVGVEATALYPCLFGLEAISMRNR